MYGFLLKCNDWIQLPGYHGQRHWMNRKRENPWGFHRSNPSSTQGNLLGGLAILLLWVWKNLTPLRDKQNNQAISSCYSWIKDHIIRENILYKPCHTPVPRNCWTTFLKLHIINVMLKWLLACICFLFWCAFLITIASLSSFT